LIGHTPGKKIPLQFMGEGTFLKVLNDNVKVLLRRKVEREI